MSDEKNHKGKREGGEQRARVCVRVFVRVRVCVCACACACAGGGGRENHTEGRKHEKKEPFLEHQLKPARPALLPTFTLSGLSQSSGRGYLRWHCHQLSANAHKKTQEQGTTTPLSSTADRTATRTAPQCEKLGATGTRQNTERIGWYAHYKDEGGEDPPPPLPAIDTVKQRAPSCRTNPCSMPLLQPWNGARDRWEDSRNKEGIRVSQVIEMGTPHQLETQYTAFRAVQSVLRDPRSRQKLSRPRSPPTRQFEPNASSKSG
jgi:hypothetical protein